MSWRAWAFDSRAEKVPHIGWCYYKSGAEAAENGVCNFTMIAGLGFLKSGALGGMLRWLISPKYVETREVASTACAVFAAALFLLCNLKI